MNIEYLLKRSEEPSKYHGKCVPMIKDRPISYMGDKVKPHEQARKDRPKKMTVILYTLQNTKRYYYEIPIIP